jgi:MoaA/NifB/PqqE/SkfB family radical SAM enzyme
MSDMAFRSARVKERARLEQVIPLSTPYQILFDSTNLCNFACEFCPTGDKALIKSVNRPSGLMDFQLFCRMIDGMKKFDRKLKRIDIGKDGEPLLNPRIVDMVRYIKDANVAELCSIATNGALLSAEMADALVDAGLDLLKISVEAVSNEGYRKISKRSFDYAALLERVHYLYDHRKQCKVYPKIIDYGLTKEEKEKFYADFNPIADYITVDYVSGWSVTSAKDFRLGTNYEQYLDLPMMNKKDVCPFPFYTLAVNFDGTVSICCVDWSLSTLVGDLRTESLPDVWNGERLFEFRCMHLRRAGYSNKACQECYTRNGLPDNIDPFADEILKRLIEQRSNAL